MNTLSELLNDAAFIALMATYAESDRDAPEQRLRQRYESFLVQLNARRFVLPVVGVQGSGKSTFLNALVFGRPVLPVDADETTSVPVEAVYAEQPSGDARVIFDDGHEERAPATEEGIELFVHQASNPANEKRVQRVVVESDHPALQSGLVLVDLPGLGSLTQANHETTLRYLNDAIGVVFMLRTVPPLTRSDSIFVVAQWARLPNALFVQNRWTDERDDEAEDGRQTNVRVLKELAKRHRIRLSSDPPVSVVNAYDALKGRLTRDDSLVHRSGLPSFTSQLEALGRDWPKRVLAAVLEALRADLAVARGQNQQQRRDLQSDRAEVEAQIRAAEEEFRKYLADLEARERAALDLLDKLGSDQQTVFDAWRQRTRQELRNLMRTKFRAGVVDGPRLERALKDEQSNFYDELVDQVQEAILVVQDDVREKFKDMPAWKAARGDPFHTVKKEEETKYEDALPKAGGSAAGLGGMFAGAKAGAAIGTAIAPGLGTVIGGALGSIVGGILGTIFGAWAGRQAKEAATAARARAVEAEVFAAIDRYTYSAVEQLSAEVERFCTEIPRVIVDWKKQQRRAYEEEQRVRHGTLNQSLEERTARLRHSQADGVRLEKYHQQLAMEVSDDDGDVSGAA